MQFCISALLLGSAPLLPALPRGEGASVSNSTIENENRNARINAVNRSKVNTGIQARGALIKDSEMKNRFTGEVNARDNSKVNTGIKADGAHIRDSKIDVNTNARINAANSTVTTGVDINGATNSNIQTRYKGTINARSATVKAGSVEGQVNNKNISTNVDENINASGKGVAIGTVKAGDGRPSRWLRDESKFNFGSRPATTSNIGNVRVDSNMVRKVDTEVGTNNFMKGLKTRHMSNVYRETGGVDNTGTKHVYVNARDKERVKRGGGSVGNTYIGKGNGKVRRVNTYVE